MIAGGRAAWRMMGGETPVSDRPEPSDQSERPEPPGTGTILAGRYELRQIVGQGELSNVYMAHDRTASRDVVVKWVRTQSENARARLQRESHVLATLSERIAGVPKHVDFVEHQGECYLVTEYIPGDTLEQWQARPHGRREILAVYERLARVLHEIHQAGVAHRDLKPSNVILPEEKERPRVVLIDVGLAVLVREEDTLTRAGTVVGTPVYMSPEMLQGRVADTPSDVFALGVMLFEALTGTQPWSGDNFRALAYGKLRQPPALGALADTRLGGLIATMLAVAHGDRPSAGAVADALAAEQRATPSEQPARPMPGPPPGWQTILTADGVEPGTSDRQHAAPVKGLAPQPGPMPRAGSQAAASSAFGPIVPLAIAGPQGRVSAGPKAGVRAVLWRLRVSIGVAVALALITLLFGRYRDRLSEVLATSPAALPWLVIPAVSLLLLVLGMRLRRDEQRAAASSALSPEIDARLRAIEQRLEHMGKVSSSLVVEIDQLRPQLDEKKLERMLRESMLIAVSELKVGADAADVGKAIKALAGVGAGPGPESEGPPPWHKRVSTWLTFGGLVIGFVGAAMGLMSSAGIWRPNAPPAIQAVTADKRRATGTAPVELRVDAVDPEGAPLAYTYQSTAGRISSNGPLALLYLDAAVADELVRVDVSVSDGKQQVSRSTTLPINRRPALAIQAPATALPGAVLSVTADGASDPDGDPLTYRWSASAGQLGSDTGRQATLTAPAGTGTVHLRCTVSDGWETWDLDAATIAIQ